MEETTQPMRKQEIKDLLRRAVVGQRCEYCDLLDQRLLLIWHLGERWNKYQMALHPENCIVLCHNCLRRIWAQNNQSISHDSSPEEYRRRLKNRDYIIWYKRNHPCTRCGEKDWKVLDFHHLDPSTKYKAVGTLSAKPLDYIKKEIAKCEILCANCHFLVEEFTDDEMYDFDELTYDWF